MTIGDPIILPKSNPNFLCNLCDIGKAIGATIESAPLSASIVNTALSCKFRR